MSDLENFFIGPVVDVHFTSPSLSVFAILLHARSEASELEAMKPHRVAARSLNMRHACFVAATGA
jgi:hypothetical protein